VGFIEQLPYSVLSITSIFTREMILLYLILVSILLMFFYKRKEWLFISLGLILLFSASFTLTEITRQRQQKIIFYSSGKQSAIGFINGEQQTLLADSVLLNDKTVKKFQFDGAGALLGITAVKAVALDTVADIKETLSFRNLGYNFFFHNKRIALIDSIPRAEGECAKLKVDYLVIRHNPRFRVSDLTKLYSPGLIIIDGSNSVYKSEKWMAEFKKAGLNTYSIKQNGAYTVDL